MYNSTILVPLIRTHGPKPLSTLLLSFCGLLAGYFGVTMNDALYDSSSSEFDVLIVLITSPIGALNLALSSLLNLPLFYHLILMLLTLFASSTAVNRRMSKIYLGIPSFITIIMGAYYHHLGILKVANWIEFSIFAIFATVFTIFRIPILDGLYDLYWYFSTD